MSGRLERAQVIEHLSRLGWRTRTTGELASNVRRFQIGWLLGTELRVDGDPGPKTSDALGISVARLNERLPTASDHYSFADFACQCRGVHNGCERIVVNRALIMGLEVASVRLYGRRVPLASPYRCPQHNVGLRPTPGAPNSQHVYGAAADVPALYSVERWKALGAFSGLGFQGSSGKVRHVDVRGIAGAPQTTPPTKARPRGATVDNPALWRYS